MRRGGLSQDGSKIIIIKPRIRRRRLFLPFFPPPETRVGWTRRRGWLSITSQPTTAMRSLLPSFSLRSRWRGGGRMEKVSLTFCSPFSTPPGRAEPTERKCCRCRQGDGEIHRKAGLVRKFSETCADILRSHPLHYVLGSCCAAKLQACSQCVTLKRVTGEKRCGSILLEPIICRRRKEKLQFLHAKKGRAHEMVCDSLAPSIQWSVA